MPESIPTAHANYQAQFQQRWPHLIHPDVRNLAWLLEAPGLLNRHHPRWNNLLAELPAIEQGTADWLAQLDREPQPLQDFLAIHPHTRLGHYAENLLAFYFGWRGQLVAHSLQVRARTTIGEFDFLLNTPDGFEHWEFACKFYLFAESASEPTNTLANFVGPNLMDNLHDKSRKIMQAQLALGQHADAQKYLPEPLHAARALLKGWLFYPSVHSQSLPEIAEPHCRGLWCRLSELGDLHGEHFLILSRLRWLAPARVQAGSSMTLAQLHSHLEQQFAIDARPVLVVSLKDCDQSLIETERIFVVPDGWNQV